MLIHMKKISLIVCALVIGCCLLAGCDKMEGESFYEIINNEDVTVDFPDVDPSSVYRKMLVEEFTGHRCTNCPQGHQILESLHQRYGDTLVAVGIHYGVLAKPNGTTFSYDFRTDDGNQIGDAYNIDAIPAAIVNRNMKEGGWNREQWATVVNEVDRSKAYAAVQIINEYDAETMALKANVKVTMLSDYANPLRLIVYMVEDGIVKPQKDGSEDILDYVHNHVLRDVLTDPFGFPLRSGAANWTAGTSETYGVTVLMANTDWNGQNCYVVAALYDDVNKEVLQVEKANVISSTK